MSKAIEYLLSVNVICAFTFIISFEEVDYGCLEDYFRNLENCLLIASQEFPSKSSCSSSEFTPHENLVYYRRLWVSSSILRQFLLPKK